MITIDDDDMEEISIPTPTGDRAKVREFESKRISNFRPRLHVSFIILHQNTGDTSANCWIFEPLRFSYFCVVARISDTRPTLPFGPKKLKRNHGVMQIVNLGFRTLGFRFTKPKP